MWRINTRLTSGIVLISAASLAYEITLTRLFAVQQFYHFAFVVISIATMGFAASGLLLSMRKTQPAPSLLAFCFSGAVLIAYITINKLPFDSYSIAWDARQWWILLLYFSVSGTPFLAAGWAIGAALDAAGTEAYRPYAANMIGAAAGCLLALAAIDQLGGEGAVGLVISIGILAGSLLLDRKRDAIALIPLAILIVVLFSIPIQPLRLALSPYKPLSSARLANEARLSVTDWGTTARLDVVESPGIHSFPGLSLNTITDLPEQAGAFLDGEGPLPITHLAADDPLAAEINGRLPSSIAYSLRSSRTALILDWGAGTPALFALTRPGISVWLPDDQPMLTDLLRDEYTAYNFELFAHENLFVIERASRSVLADRARSYDIIEFALSDMFQPVTSGAFSLGEDYLLTVDAFTDAWNRLNPDGVLVITRWIGTPPSESARTWNTVLTALRHAGVDGIKEHVIAFRGIRTATMIVSPQAFSANELHYVRQFLELNAFDPLILPDLDPGEVNRFNRLPEPVYHELFTALLNEPGETVSKYAFRLDAPGDDRPYFNHFFRWGQTPEVLASLGLFWQPFGGSGYFVLLVLMGLMLFLAALLIVFSLLSGSRAHAAQRPDMQALLYFAALGSGYLLVEIPLIQRFTLLLDHPAQALAGVLFVLLFGSGIGSWLSPRLSLKRALLALLIYLGFILSFSSDLIDLLLPAPALVRWGALVLILLPLGILMGVPFAAGLQRLENNHPGWIPWAWAVNGAFSGISGVAAAMLALDAGFRATLAAGWVAYALAAASRNLQSGRIRSGIDENTAA